MNRLPSTRLALASLLLIAWSVDSQAQCPGPGTSVSGTVANAHWTLAGCPYIVINDLNLVNVVIDAGVVVQIDGNYGINVAAGLAALGTQAAPIQFTSTTGDWNGISFNGSQSGCVMEWCIVEKADQPGVTVVNSLPQIENCTIQDNISSIFGGGIRVEVATGNFSLKGCTVRRNRSLAHGGGMFINMGNGFSCILENCTIKDNAVNEGGVVVNTSFFGGGVYFAPSEGRLIGSGCKFSGNSVTASTVWDGPGSIFRYALGAGLYAQGGDVTLAGCEFVENWSRAPCVYGGAQGFGRGAGVYFVDASKSLDIRNSIFACNSSLVPTTVEATGSSVYLESGTALLANCTLVRNGVVWPGSPDPTFYNLGGVASIRNSILYNNNPSGTCPGAVSYGAQIGGAGTTTVSYSDVEGGYAGPGNINVNPVLTNPGAPNCDATAPPSCGSINTALVNFTGAPCIDTGDPGAADRDVCFPPSYGTTLNDMGATGGPAACPNSSPALVGSRVCGTNPVTYVAGKVILGRLWTATVSCPPSGEPVVVIGFSLAPIRLQLPNGSCLLVDPRFRVFTLGPGACPFSTGQPVPVNVALIGCPLYSQAAHLGGGSYILSNSQDLIIGTY